MRLKTNVIALAISGTLFAACCLVMLQFGPQMNSKVFVYPFTVVWGSSALVWPPFAVRTLGAVLAR
jgi:ABC-type Fe3+ transport system permease subunit